MNTGVWHRTVRRRKSISIRLALAGLSAASHASAYCGLEHCPIGHRPERPAQWVAGISWRMVTFERGAGEAGFQQGAARLEWRPSRHLILGADLPISAPLTASGPVYGFSNPLVFAEAGIPLPGDTRFSAGGQFEVPYGDVSEGFASGHAMAVGYLAAGRDLGSFSLSTRLGWSTAVPYRAAKASADPSYDNPLGVSARTARGAHSRLPPAGKRLFIEPHADRDLLFRIESRWKSRAGTAALNLNGAHAMDPIFTPENALSWGASFELPLEGKGNKGSGGNGFGKGFSIQPEIRFPLTRPSRFESAGGIGIKRVF